MSLCVHHKYNEKLFFTKIWFGSISFPSLCFFPYSILPIPILFCPFSLFLPLLSLSNYLFDNQCHLLFWDPSCKQSQSVVLHNSLKTTRLLACTNLGNQDTVKIHLKKKKCKNFQFSKMSILQNSDIPVVANDIPKMLNTMNHNTEPKKSNTKKCDPIQKSTIIRSIQYSCEIQHLFKTFVSLSNSSSYHRTKLLIHGRQRRWHIHLTLWTHWTIVWHTVAWKKEFVQYLCCQKCSTIASNLWNTIKLFFPIKLQ